MKILKISAVAVALVLSTFSADAAKMTIAECNVKCTEETGKTGSIAELKACFKGCPGSEVGDVALAAAKAHGCKENHNQPECQVALNLGGKWFLDVGNDENANGDALRELVKKTDAADK
ncbi:MAG: hypothetical protein K2W94_01585 [Alphaproteobacteria bacterium]|nr:hypothetical protein [Alphaproteobacteria bacterium]